MKEKKGFLVNSNRIGIIVVLLGILVMAGNSLVSMGDDEVLYQYDNDTWSFGPTILLHFDNGTTLYRYASNNGSMIMIFQVEVNSTDNVVSMSVQDTILPNMFASYSTPVAFANDRGIYANWTILGINTVLSNNSEVAATRMVYPSDTYSILSNRALPLVTGKLYYDNNDPTKPRYYYIVNDAGTRTYHVITIDGMPSVADQSPPLLTVTLPNQDLLDIVVPVNSTNSVFLITNTTVLNYTMTGTTWSNTTINFTLGTNTMLLRGFWRNNSLYVLAGPTQGSLGNLTLYKIQNNNIVDTIQVTDEVSGYDVYAANYGMNNPLNGEIQIYNYSNSAMILTTGAVTGAASLDSAIKTINIYLYNDTENTLKMIRYLNLTDTINKGTSTFTQPIYSLSMETNDDMYIGFVTTNTTANIVYLVKAGYGQPTPSAGQQSTQPSPLQLIAMIGGENETYTLEGVALEYDNNGLPNRAWIVAGDQEVNTTGGARTPIEGTQGVSIFKMDFNLTANPPVQLQQVLETYSIMRAYNSLPFLIDYAVVVTGANNTVDKGMILVYNTTTNSYDKKDYDGLGPIVGVGTTETNYYPGQPLGFIITNNGTIYYVNSAELPPPSINNFINSNYQLPIYNWTSGETDGVVFARPTDDALASYISVATNTTTTNNLQGGVLNLYKLEKNGLTLLTQGKGLFYQGLNESTISIRDTYILNLTDSNGTPYDLVVISLYDAANNTGHLAIYNSSDTTFTEPLQAAGIVFYGLGYSLTYGPLVAGGVFNSSTNTYDGVIFMVNLASGDLTPIASLALSNANIQLMSVLQLNTSYMLTLGRAYASPDNLTVAGGTTSPTAPVPEPWITTIVLAVVLLIGLTLFTKKKTQ